MQRHLALALLCASGCADAPPPPASPGSTPALQRPPASAVGSAPAASAPAAATLDTRSAADFARAWGEALALPDEALRAERAMAIGPAWLGRRLRWTGLALAGLCRMAERQCAVNFFPRTSTPMVDRLGGFFPRVTFEPAAFEALRRGCTGQPTCVVEVEATLADAKTDPEVPLRLDFVAGQVLATRAERPEDGYFRPMPAPSSAARTSPKPGAAPSVSPPVVRPPVF